MSISNSKIKASEDFFFNKDSSAVSVNASALPHYNRNSKEDIAIQFDPKERQSPLLFSYDSETIVTGEIRGWVYHCSGDIDRPLRLFVVND